MKGSKFSLNGNSYLQARKQVQKWLVVTSMMASTVNWWNIQFNSIQFKIYSFINRIKTDTKLCTMYKITKKMLLPNEKKEIAKSETLEKLNPLEIYKIGVKNVIVYKYSFYEHDSWVCTRRNMRCTIQQTEPGYIHWHENHEPKPECIILQD